ncbi:MAG TPA: tellurite resistance/C4-dicarboxylate transporter family protein, partial [Deinococcales bacterium]|nr:tellurite resistance/C4-dicarboxylate transporter family protein [Deinococcales bacterium]
FLAGTVLYLLVIGLIFYRFTFLPVTPAQLTAPYWINMGALAITTLAGLSLLEASPALPELAGLQPLLPGLALLFWSFGTWWIPLLVVFGAWRHFVARHPLSYSPEYWGLVFPLGMYSVATRKLQELFAFEVLGVVAQVFALLGFAAWLLTLTGMLLSWLPGRRAGAA